MGILDSFVSKVQGYFRENEEDVFPWKETGRSVWYALFIIEDGKINKYGFTASKTQKWNLLQALKAISPSDEAILLGVWTGKYKTDLFILNIEAAISNFSKLD